MDTADNLGQKTLAATQAVCSWNDGKVGEVLEEIGTWWIQGISGGLYEGVGEGMEVLGLRPAGRAGDGEQRRVRAKNAHRMR